MNKKKVLLLGITLISILLILIVGKTTSSFKSYALPTPESWHTDYTYTLDETNKTITITKYNGTDTNLIVYPSATINGKTYSTIVNGEVYRDKSTIESIVFENGVKAGASLRYAFSGLTSLESITFNDFDTSATTDMFAMFYLDSKLTSLDVSRFDTSNVTNMQAVFGGLKSLESVDVSNWDTSNVTVMFNMFYGCSSLTSLDLSNFDTSKVTSMRQMFYGCSSLTSIDLSNFDTSKVTSMRQMFRDCKILTNLDLSSFDTSNVTDMSGMFWGIGIENLDLSNFDTSKTTNINSLFRGANSLKTLDISSFDTRHITQFFLVFYNNVELNKLIIGENTKLSTGDTFYLSNASWKKQENGLEYRGSRIPHEPGTYIKLRDYTRNITPDFNFDYKIEKMYKIDYFTTTHGDIFQMIDNKRVIAKVPITNTEEYNVPGSFEIIINDAVSDVYGNKYNLKMKVDNIALYDLLAVPGNDELYTTIISIPKNYPGIIQLSTGYYSSIDDIGKYGSNSIKINNNDDSRGYDITLSVIDDNGISQDGSYIFSAHDLDGPSWRDGNGGTGETNRGYGSYSEGVFLNEGFDLNTLKMHEATILQVIDNNRITGTRNDPETVLSDFLIKADAKSSKFRWTTGYEMNTQLFMYYQPNLVELEKVDNYGNKVNGAVLELYNSNNVLMDSWTTSNENKKMFLMPGEYTLKEKTNPNDKKYENAKDIIFNVESDKIIINNEEVSKVSMVDSIKKYSYTISYFDEKGNQMYSMIGQADYGSIINTKDKMMSFVDLTFDKSDKESIMIGENDNKINIYFKKSTQQTNNTQPENQNNVVPNTTNNNQRSTTPNTLDRILFYLMNSAISFIIVLSAGYYIKSKR